jgi:hypothetical protein
MSEALVAVVGSIVAALLGGVVGALINGRATRAIEEQRAERDAARETSTILAAARLVYTDLAVAHLLLEQVRHAATSEAWLRIQHVPTMAWHSHGVELARALTETDYDTVSEACTKVTLVKTGVDNPAVQMWLAQGRREEDLDLPQSIEKLCGMTENAIAKLHPIAYPKMASENGTTPTAP